MTDALTIEQLATQAEQIAAEAKAFCETVDKFAARVDAYLAPAPPKVELPTEVGYYVDDAKKLWRQSRVGVWHEAERFSEPLALWEFELLYTGVLVLMEPRAVTAKKVIDALWLRAVNNNFVIGTDAISAVRAEFGVKETSW